MQNNSKYKIILASGSPRRQQFFKDMGFPYTIDLKPVDEVYPTHLQGPEITNYLALLKANAFDGFLKSDQVVVTSDTLVWHENKALGKPKDALEAFDMLSSLSNATHSVFTSVCFKTLETSFVFFEESKVTFGVLTPEMIQYYIDNYQPFDKAGSYGIQEWIGEVGITKIDGSYTNIVGLPVSLVYTKLNELLYDHD